MKILVRALYFSLESVPPMILTGAQFLLCGRGYWSVVPAFLDTIVLWGFLSWFKEEGAALVQFAWDRWKVGTTHMYISLLRSLLNQAQPKVALLEGKL